MVIFSKLGTNCPQFFTIIQYGPTFSKLDQIGSKMGKNWSKIIQINRRNYQNLSKKSSKMVRQNQVPLSSFKDLIIIRVTALIVEFNHDGYINFIVFLYQTHNPLFERALKTSIVYFGLYFGNFKLRPKLYFFFYSHWRKQVACMPFQQNFKYDFISWLLMAIHITWIPKNVCFLWLPT